MENQTGYDLNGAIESWGSELAAQPDLTPDVRRELETHLRDTVAELQRRGLNDEESFWLARRRVGQPMQIGGEFTKVDPMKAWRIKMTQAAMMVLTLLMWCQTISHLWFCFQQSWLNALYVIMPYKPLYPALKGILSSESFGTLLLPFLSFALILPLAIHFYETRLKRFTQRVQFIFRSRLHLLCAFAGFFLAYFVLLLAVAPLSHGDEFARTPFSHLAAALGIEFGLLPMLFACWIAWLMPTSSLTTPERC